jgi:hypothetical protein
MNDNEHFYGAIFAIAFLVLVAWFATNSADKRRLSNPNIDLKNMVEFRYIEGHKYFKQINNVGHTHGKLMHSENCEHDSHKTQTP